MCDYSLHSVRTRSAKVGEKLITYNFGTGTRGFAASEQVSVAVCVLPGTELAFADEVKRLPVRLWPWRGFAIGHKTAIFRQVNKDRIAAHHDALEFPDGEIVLPTLLAEGQQLQFFNCLPNRKRPRRPSRKHAQPTSADHQRYTLCQWPPSIGWPPCGRTR